jgi:hypothetical protein
MRAGEVLLNSAIKYSGSTSVGGIISAACFMIIAVLHDRMGFGTPHR